MIVQYDIELYVTERGKCPFQHWMDKLKDQKAGAAIKLRLRRMQLGNLGDCKSIGAGVFEMRVDFGPGYRVYYGKTGRQVILLLCAGNKSTQDKDIQSAKEYLYEFQKRSE